MEKNSVKIYLVNHENDTKRQLHLIHVFERDYCFLKYLEGGIKKVKDLFFDQEISQIKIGNFLHPTIFQSFNNAYFHLPSRFLEDIANHKYMYINVLNNLYGKN